MSGASLVWLVGSLVTAESGNTLAAAVPDRVCVTAERQAMSLLRASDGAPSNISGIAALRLKERYAAARGKTLPLEFEPSAHHASSYCRDRSRTIYLDLTYQALAAGQPYRMTYTLRWPGGEQSGGTQRDLAKGLADSLRLPISPLWQLLDLALTRHSDMLAAILVKRGRPTPWPVRQRTFGEPVCRMSVGVGRRAVGAPGNGSLSDESEQVRAGGSRQAALPALAARHRLTTGHNLNRASRTSVDP